MQPDCQLRAFNAEVTAFPRIAPPPCPHSWPTVLVLLFGMPGVAALKSVPLSPSVTLVRRGQSYPRQTKVTKGESGTPSKTASLGIPNKRTNTVGQLWGHGGGAISGEAITSTLNARS